MEMINSHRHGMVVNGYHGNQLVITIALVLNVNLNVSQERHGIGEIRSVNNLYDNKNTA